MKKSDPSQDLQELSEYRQLIMGALSDGLRTHMWDFVFKKIPDDERVKRVVDMDSGLGDHLNGLSLVEKHKIITLEDNVKAAKELKKKHVLVKVFKGNWTDMHQAIGKDYENIRALTGFNLGPGLWPDELKLFIKEAAKLPNLRRIALVNDLGPIAGWSGSKGDISEKNYIRMGTDPRPKFKNLVALRTAMENYEKALCKILEKEDFRFENFEGECLGEYPMTQLHWDEQHKRFSSLHGLRAPSRDDVDSFGNLNIFFREIGAKETHTRNGARIMQNRIGQVVTLWGTRAWR